MSSHAPKKLLKSRSDKDARKARLENRRKKAASQNPKEKVSVASLVRNEEVIVTPQSVDTLVISQKRKLRSSSSKKSILATLPLSRSSRLTVVTNCLARKPSPKGKDKVSTSPRVSSLILTDSPAATAKKRHAVIAASSESKSNKKARPTTEPRQPSKDETNKPVVAKKPIVSEKTQHHLSNDPAPNSASTPLGRPIVPDYITPIATSKKSPLEEIPTNEDFEILLQAIALLPEGKDGTPSNLADFPFSLFSTPISHERQMMKIPLPSPFLPISPIVASNRFEYDVTPVMKNPQSVLGAFDGHNLSCYEPIPIRLLSNETAAQQLSQGLDLIEYFDMAQA